MNQVGGEIFQEKLCRLSLQNSITLRPAIFAAERNSSFCILHSTFLQRPFIPPVGVTMAMRGEETAAMLPEQRPDLFAIRLRQIQGRQFVVGKELKISLAMRRRQRFQSRFDFEQKHQPVRLPFVAVLADESGQMQIARLNRQPQFFLCFATGTGVRRFAGVSVKFAAARTPKATIGFLRAFQQQHVILIVETIEQRRNFVRQSHRPSYFAYCIWSLRLEYSLKLEV